MLLDIAPSEFLVIAGAAIIFIGPKDMPRALRTAGKWFAQMRRVSNHFRAGVDNLIREAEMAEMEKEWRERNAAIMAAHPPAGEIPTGEAMGVPALTHAGAPEPAGAGHDRAGMAHDPVAHDPMAHDPMATAAYGDHGPGAATDPGGASGGHDGMVPRWPTPQGAPPGTMAGDVPGVAAPFATMPFAAMPAAAMPVVLGDPGEPELPLSTPRQPLP